MDFNDISGHKDIIEHIKSSIENNRVNHAYIFDGPSGIGKLTLAKAFAKTLNCERGGSQSCNECTSCKTFDENNNPDIIYVTHRTAGITVDDVRDQIVKNISLKPYRNRYKIFIIEDAHKMNEAAQNAFLKSLEEPPPYGVFLLLSENYSNFLVTIVSRCITFKLKPLPYDMVAEYIVKNKGISMEQALLYAGCSMGNIGRALELADSDEFRELRDKGADMVLRLEKADMIELYEIIDSVKEDRKALDTILEIMYMIYRDALVLIKTGDKSRLIQTDKLLCISEVAGCVSSAALIKRCEAIEDTRVKLRNNGNIQLLLETLFFKIKEK